MFHDLCVSARSAKDQDKELTVKRAIELGYSAIAWNTTVASKALQTVKATKVQPVTTKLIRESAQQRKLTGISPLRDAADFKQYTRITVIADDATDAQNLTTANAALMNFDIVASSPRSLSAFLHLCKQADVDIISLDFSHRMTFHIDQKHVAAAVKTGILFEITYSPIIQASATRRQVMEGTSLVVEYTRGKWFVMGSDADNWGQLRGPHDVLNIGCVIGLPEEQARKALCENCGIVLQHAYSRKLRYTSVEILSRPEFAAKWSAFDGLVGPQLARQEPLGCKDTADGSDMEGDEDSFDGELEGLSGIFNKGAVSNINVDEGDFSDDRSSGSEVDEEPGAANSHDGSSSPNSGASLAESTYIVPIKKSPGTFSDVGGVIRFDSKPLSSGKTLDPVKKLQDLKQKNSSEINTNKSQHNINLGNKSMKRSSLFATDNAKQLQPQKKFKKNHATCK